MSLNDLLTVVNSDPRSTLNHMIWLDCYKTYGKNSYVYHDKNIFDELCRSKIAVNDPDMATDIMDLARDAETGVGKFLSQIYGIAHPEELAALDTVVEIALSVHWDDWFANTTFSNIFKAKPVVLLNNGVTNYSIYTSGYTYCNVDNPKCEYDSSEQAIKFIFNTNQDRRYPTARLSFYPEINLKNYSRIRMSAKYLDGFNCSFFMTGAGTDPSSSGQASFSQNLPNAHWVDYFSTESYATKMLTYDNTLSALDTYKFFSIQYQGGKPGITTSDTIGLYIKNLVLFA